MDKNVLLHSIINETLEELTTDYQTFDEYKKGMANGDGKFVYSQVDRDSIPNICTNGAAGAKEFFNTMVYGRGIYTVLSYDECCSYDRCNAMIKYAVKKGAYDNFLIFDVGIRKQLQQSGALTLHEKISQTVKRLFPDSVFRRLESYYGPDLHKLDEQVVACNHNHNSSYIQDNFRHLLVGGERNIELRKGLIYNSESILDESNVDGWGYYDYYGSVLIFRTHDLLVPYSYGLREHHSWQPESQFKYCINDSETFDNINVAVDAFRRGRKDYPDTNFTEKTVCGFSLVKKGKKYNLLNARTEKYFSPVDFDSCTTFNPVTQMATFTINDEEDGVIEFMIHSEERGKHISMFYRTRDENNGEMGWQPISYSDFLEAVGGITPLNEVFTHKDFNTFKSSLSNSRNVILYRATSPATAKAEFESGSNMEYSGTAGDNSLYYGLGVYTVRNTSSLNCGKYGSGVVKFVLKDGYKNFLIFDDEVRAKWDPGKTVYDELVALVPKDILHDIDKFLKSGMAHTPGLNNSTISSHVIKNGVEGYRNTNITPGNNASFARAIKFATQGRNMHDPLAPAIYDELIIAKTKIRGFVFTGGMDGNVVMVRDFNSLMPIDYSVDCGRTWIGNFTEKQFNTINQKVDPFYSYRGEYETTDLRAKAICGFSLVSGKQGYNYKDIWFHRPLLPIDVESATPFNPITKTAKFKLCDVDFEIATDDDMNISLFYEDEGSMSPCDFDEFMAFVTQAKEDGLIAPTKIYNNSLLNPNNDRGK